QDYGEGNQLNSGLPLGQPADRQHNLDVAQELPQAGNEELAEQDGAGRDHVEGGEAAVPGQNRYEDADQQLVGNGIEHAAERGILVPGAGEIAIEPVGRGGDDIDDQRDQPQHHIALHDQQDNGDDRQDAGDGDDVGDEGERVSGHGGSRTG